MATTFTEGDGTVKRLWHERELRTGDCGHTDEFIAELNADDPQVTDWTCTACGTVSQAPTLWKTSGGDATHFDSI